MLEILRAVTEVVAVVALLHLPEELLIMTNVIGVSTW